MARSRYRGRPVALPWEGRFAWLRDLFRGQRWLVLVLAGLGAILVYGLVLHHDDRTKARRTRTTLVEIQRAVAAFRADLGRCPQTTYELVHPPRGGQRYLRRIPADGWGRALHLQCPGRYDPDGADIISAGPSGNFLVDDNLQ